VQRAGDARPRRGVDGVGGELDDEPVAVAAGDQVVLGVGVLAEAGGRGLPRAQDARAQAGGAEDVAVRRCGAALGQL
jgi:hypothetical protein